jgi:hypothetical protein
MRSVVSVVPPEMSMGSKKESCLTAGGGELTSGMVNANKAKLNPDNHNMIQKAHLHPLATTA